MSEDIPVTKQIVEIMKTNRKERRRVAKINGLKNIPSIIHTNVRRATAEEVQKIYPNMKPVESTDEDGNTVTKFEMPE